MTISSNHYIYNLCQLVNLCQTREDWSNISFPEIKGVCEVWSRLPSWCRSSLTTIAVQYGLEAGAGERSWLDGWSHHDHQVGGRDRGDYGQEAVLPGAALYYLGVVSHQHQLFGSFSPGPGHRVSGGAADDGGQELPLPPGTLIRLKGNKQWTFHSFSSGYKQDQKSNRSDRQFPKF